MAETRPTQVVTDKVRLSFVHLFTPYAHQQGQEPKYSCTVLVPKSDVATKARIDAAIEAARQDGLSRIWGGAAPPNLPVPVYDGDGVRPNGESFGPECKGCWVFTAGSKQAPQVVDAAVQPILDQTEIYSGIYGRVSVNFFPYFAAGRKGIGCGLNNVQKLEGGEPLGGRTTAAEDFGSAPQVAAPAYQQPVQTASGVQTPGTGLQNSTPGWI